MKLELTESKARKVMHMIEKECCRNSLEELCEYWDVTVDEFDLFLEYAMRYIDLNK